MTDAACVETAGPLTCSVCGRSSTLRSAFTHGRDGTVPRTWCPRCSVKHAEKLGLALAGSYLLSLALGWFLVARVPANAVYPFMLGCAAFLSVELLMVLPHEMGHALAARLVGFRPVAIRIGGGALWVDRYVLGVRLQIGRTLRGGATLPDLQAVDDFRWRMITVLAAGPAVNLLAGVGALWAARYVPVDSMSPMLRAAAIGFGAGNLAHTWRGLWPRTVRSPIGAVLNDGAQIAKYWRGFKPNVEAQRAAMQLLRASFAYRDRDFEAARRETALAESNTAKVELQACAVAMRAEALSESGQPQAALQALAPLRARTDLTDEARLAVDQAFAWAAFLCDESGLIEQGCDSIQRCAALMPWDPVIMIKQVCLLAVGATTNPERLADARRRAEELGEFRLLGESRAYAALARGLLACADRDVQRARQAYGAAKNAQACEMALQVLERRLASG